MARVQLLLCFTILFASVALLDVASAHMIKVKPAVPKVEPPKTVKDVETYTVNIVMIYLTDLEKECPKTNKFKAFFEKCRAYAKYVCPIRRIGEKDYDRDMKAKAGSLLQTISSFAIGRIRDEIQEEKMEAINTIKFLKTVGGKIMGGRKEEENEDSMTLTVEQQNEIKEAIIKWQVLITRIANTILVDAEESSSSGEKSTSAKEVTSKTGSSGEKSTGAKEVTGETSSSDEKSTSGKEASTGKKSSSDEKSTSGKEVSTDTKKNSGTETTSKDTTASNPKVESPSGSPSSKKTDSKSSEASLTANTETSKKGSEASLTGSTETSKNSASSGESAVTMTEVEDETSKEVMAFIMNLEKKCPPKEEYQSFFEKLKGTMTGKASSSPRNQRGIFSGLRAAAGKLSDAMAFMRSRLEVRSAEVKQSMETYQEEVMKAVEELDAIYSQIQSQNKGKQQGTVTITETQRVEIKQTITRWEKVTTQFVETAVQSESSSSSSSSSSLGKVAKAN